MKLRIVTLIAALLLSACQREGAGEDNTGAADTAISGIELSAMDTSIKPGDDFFGYVNGSWLAQTEMPADKSRYNVFSILADQAQDNVKVIIEASADPMYLRS